MTRAWHADHGRDHGPHGHDPTPAGPWHYASPLSPAPDPSDLIPVADDVASAAFKNGWANTTLSDGTTYSPLRWRFTSAGKKQIEGAIDGGALGTVCVTLPAEFGPAKDEVRVISSVDGSRAITVSISATNGDVTVIGFPQSSVTLSANQVTTSTIADGAVTSAKLATTGVTAATYGDATHVGQFTVNAEGQLTAASSVAITAGVTSVAKNGSTAITGAVTLTGGTGITLTESGQDITIAATGGGGGSALTDSIAQTSHGLAVGNVVRFDGTNYVKAKADTAADAEVVGIVSAVADANNFTLTTGGRITGLSGLVAGDVYFLDPVTAGALTTTEPTTVGFVTKPLLIADSTTSGYLFNFRGEVIFSGSTGSGGGVGGALYLYANCV